MTSNRSRRRNSELLSELICSTLCLTHLNQDRRQPIELASPTVSSCEHIFKFKPVLTQSDSSLITVSVTRHMGFTETCKNDSYGSYVRELTRNGTGEESRHKRGNTRWNFLLHCRGGPFFRSNEGKRYFHHLESQGEDSVLSDILPGKRSGGALNHPIPFDCVFLCFETKSENDSTSQNEDRVFRVQKTIVGTLVRSDLQIECSTHFTVCDVSRTVKEEELINFV